MSNEMPMKKQSFLGGAAVLALATAVVKLIGMFFKIPLQMVIHEAGYGYFTTAYDIYSVLLMISTTGLPVAISRMISEARWSWVLPLWGSRYSRRKSPTVSEDRAASSPWIRSIRAEKHWDSWSVTVSWAVIRPRVWPRR